MVDVAMTSSTTIATSLFPQQQQPQQQSHSSPPAVPPGMDVTYYALSLLRRRRLSACIALAAHHLHSRTPVHTSSNNNDKDTTTTRMATSAGGVPLASTAGQQLWFIQTRAMVLQSYYKDAEVDDDDGEDNLMGDGGGGGGEAGVVSNAHRPHTSLRTARQGTAAGAGGGRGGGGGGGAAAVSRPLSSRYGFARPGSHTGNRPGTRCVGSSSGGGGAGAGGGRLGTSARSGSSRGVRAVSARFARVATATLLSASDGGVHLDVQRLPLAKYARTRPLLAKLLCDYILYVERKPRLALDLCYAALTVQTHRNSNSNDNNDNNSNNGGASAPLQSQDDAVARRHLPPRRLPLTRNNNNKVTIVTTDAAADADDDAASAVVMQGGVAQDADWYWHARLAKSYYQLSLLRDAERHYKDALFAHAGNSSSNSNASSSFAHYHTLTVMELGKVYTRLDQPLTALELYRSALQHNPVDHHILLAMARLHEALHEPHKAFDLYKRVLELDSSSVEAIACVAAHCYYERSMPELALRYYRRLLQMGVHEVEVWGNVAMCAAAAEQYDVALTYLHTALRTCRDDAARADVWYNVSHVALNLGDVALAQRALRLAVAADDTHAEALNNLAVLLLHCHASSCDDDDDGDVEDDDGGGGEDEERKKSSSATKQQQRRGRQPRNKGGERMQCEVGQVYWSRDPTRIMSVRDDDGDGDGDDGNNSAAAARTRRGVRELLQFALQAAPDLPEPLYNAALLHYRAGRLAEAHRLVTHALNVEPYHATCTQLQELLYSHLTS